MDPAPAQVASTVADGLIESFRAAGARRLFGVPGGGSSLDLIESARARAMPFVLARHECAAVMMAAATAELDGAIGVALTTKGPGTANGANGVAHAALDRCPVAVLTDGFSPAHRAYVTHQWFDQRALYAPLVKAHATFETAPTRAQIDALVARARTPRRGPVHVELTGAAARAPLQGSRAPLQDSRAPLPDSRAPLPDSRAPLAPTIASPASSLAGGNLADAVRPPWPPLADEAPTPGTDAAALGRAASLLASAKRPVVVVGLEARDALVAAAARRLVDALDCAALVTYKAKGVIADDSPGYVGIFTGGAAEQAAVNDADLIVLVGVDPVEFILQPWPYAQPVLEIGWVRHPLHYVRATQAVHGDLPANLVALAGAARRAAWSPETIAARRASMRESLAYRGAGAELTPEQVVAIAAEVARPLAKRPRVSVDAGAHMFSATAFWPCAAPNELLISNGLASMGFALPAGIAAALHEPGRTAIAFTGDGGLLMCLGELATAVEQRARLVVIVFNDGALSLIDIKQQSRRLPAEGVRWPHVDFAAAMQGVGGLGLRARTVGGYRRALERAFAADGPALVDVRVDPSGYAAQLRAMRG